MASYFYFLINIVTTYSGTYIVLINKKDIKKRKKRFGVRLFEKNKRKSGEKKGSFPTCPGRVHFRYDQ